MEDLADSHPSDSDDYSELSVEEEEEQQGKQGLFNLGACALKPKTFKCQTCEKSYIGKGGLARHLKLHPDHSTLQPEMLPSGKASGSQTQARAEGRAAGLTAALDGLQSVGGQEALVPEPARGRCSALLGTERRRGPDRGCSTAPAEPSAAGPEQSRARLKEWLHRCDRQDLVELALPQLAQVVTVYEFLLMKVGNDHLAKPFFPAVYKEFEELHRMVKEMYQDYRRSSGPSPQEPLEINNNEVAKSLGITEELREKDPHADGTPHACSSGETDGGEPGAASPRKRESETAEEGLAAVKRTRRAALPEVPTESSADSRGQREQAGCATSEGFAHLVNGDACHCPDAGPSASQVGQQLEAPADFAASSRSADVALLCPDVSGLGVRAHPGQPAVLALEQMAVLPVEHTQGHALDLNTRASLGSQGHGSSLVSQGEGASLPPGGSGHAEVGKPCPVPGSHGHGQHTSPGEALLLGAAAPPQEEVLSGHAVPTPCASSAVSELGPRPSADGGLGSHLEGVDPAIRRTGMHAEQRELEGVVAVAEAMAFEVADGCHELLSQGREQIFIQTSTGLILPHPGSVVPGEQDIVILTEVEGPVPQAGPPEGTPLETVEADPSR